MKLSEYFTFKNVTAKEFATSIGASESSVSQWAAGDRIPRSDQMRAIFDATSGIVTPNDFHGFRLVGDIQQ